jgi:peptide/nickel transport system substrate-binding protein
MRITRWLVVLVALVWGCTESPAPSPTAPDSTTSTTSPDTTSAPDSTTTLPPPGNSETLRVGTTVPVNSLDPADAFNLGDWEILHAVGEGLLRIEPGGSSIVTGMAEALPEVSDDGRTYTFTIRQDVEFPDGTALIAPAYVAGLQRAMRLGGRSADLISLYVNRVEATDEYTVVFHLRDAFAFFPTLVAGIPYLAYHPDAFPEDELTPMPEAPLYGAGRWYIETLTDAEVVLEQNPRHPDAGLSPRRIVIRIFETAESMAEALGNGDLDLIWRGVDGATASLFSGTEGLTVTPVAGGTSHFLTVNHRSSPTDDHLVRQALAELVDREAVIRGVLGDGYEPSYSPVPTGYPGSTEVFRDLYGAPDVARAIDLLTEAGYTEADRAEIELGYPPERFGLGIAAAMEQLELQIESTGLVDVTLTAQPWTTYVGAVVAGTYDVAFLGWVHDYPDPHNYLAPFVLEGGLGGSGERLATPDLADMVTAAALETEPGERTRLYQEIQRLYAEDVVTIPLWIHHGYVIYTERVSGSVEHPHPEALNIGPAAVLDYRSISLTGADD